MKPEQPVKPVLIFAYGNPSRGDDALGPECLSAMEGWLQGNSLQSQIELLTDFQLQVEHATDLVGRRLVVFVDASVSVPARVHIRSATSLPWPTRSAGQTQRRDT